ncbi:MAG: tRNA pseudouridine(38-40) synthase TruA [Bacteroidota bacterium]|nr:tRNA pseudouridine(38-40) synthase TruA [Bacteroidota bacterium]
MNRYFLKLAYKGSNYHGWQVQDNADSIQEILQDAMALVMGMPEIHLVGCGRTDTGVHASEFYAHFDLEENPESVSKMNLPFKLNRFLPKDITIHQILPVTANANARFDAIRRTYQYFIIRKKDPFKQETAYHYFGPLDIEKMNKGAKMLYEFEDFTSFSKLHTQVKTNNCKVMHAEWTEKDSDLIFTITADRFLRNMVRAIAGTLMDLGRGKIDLQDVSTIIESKDRSKAGVSVPAEGLFLTQVEYPEHIFL